MFDEVQQAVLCPENEIRLAILIEVTSRRAGRVTGNITTGEIADFLEYDLCIPVCYVAIPHGVL